MTTVDLSGTVTSVLISCVLMVGTSLPLMIYVVAEAVVGLADLAA